MRAPISKKWSLLVICSVLLLTLHGCATLPRKVSRHLDRHEFVQARELLEKEGAGAQVAANAKSEALEARRLFARAVATHYGRHANQLVDAGSVRAALRKTEEGLEISPWSDELLSLKREIEERIYRVDKIESKWKSIASSDRVPMKDARLFLADIAKVGSDFKDTKSLVAIQKLVISSIASFWSNRIKNEVTPITERSLDVFRSDIESAGVSYLITTDCVDALVDLCILQDRLREFSISDHKDEIFRGAVCLQAAKRTDAVSPGDKITEAARAWVERWYGERLPLVVKREGARFDTVDSYEALLSRMSPHKIRALEREVGLLHLRAAEHRAGAGASAAIALLHVARALDLHGDLPKGRVEAVQKTAVSSMLAGERLRSVMAIDCEPKLDPQLYDLVRAAIMIEVRSRTEDYFSWQFLPPGDRDSPADLVIDEIDFRVPDYDELTSITSEYFSHFESVPNPYKIYLETLLSSAKWQLEWAENSYNSAVNSHNIYPTQYSLMNVNNAYNNYVARLNAYNSLVRQYNATPSTVQREVFMPYIYKEGHVQYGWELRVKYKIGNRSRIATGWSMDSDFVRIGTRYNDKNVSRRRDDDLDFDVSFERTWLHLFKAVKTVCDEIAPAIHEVVPLRYAAGFDEREAKIAKWLLHPWGLDVETGRKMGISDWVLSSVSSIKLPEIEYKPGETYVRTMSEKPTLPLDAMTAAKWYSGLVGQVLAANRRGSRSTSTGAVISPDGLILTCAHGLEGEDLRIEFANAPWAGTYQAEVVFVNDDMDVALIRAKGLKTNRWMEIRLASGAEKGEEIVAIGNPSLPDGSRSIEAISRGVVSNPASDLYGIPRVVADITIASGSSGGPIISLRDGKIIGIVVAVADAGLARVPGERSASGMVCLAVPAERLGDWLGLRERPK